MTPDQNQMFAHLEHLFGGGLDGHEDGLIEIAWIGAATGRLSEAKLFGTEAIDEAVELAATVNTIRGQNVYVCAALRKPDTPSRRCQDEHFLCGTAFYTDLDDSGAVEAAPGKYPACRPNLVVVTGRHPHLRAQMWWRLSDPVVDPIAFRTRNAALAHHLGGDPTVVNVGRVMRLGGSVAWARKDGRVDEMTEVKTFNDRPMTYLPEQVKAAFPDAPNGGKPTSRSIDEWRTLIQSGVDETKRNNTITSIVGHLLVHNVDIRIAHDLMQAWNQSRCRPPLPPEDVARIVRSIGAAELRSRQKAKA